MAKAKTLLDDVKASLNDRKGYAPWYETLPKETAEELAAIKAAWISGTLATTKTALAHSISKALKTRGKEIGYAGVIRWLERP